MIEKSGDENSQQDGPRLSIAPGQDKSQELGFVSHFAGEHEQKRIENSFQNAPHLRKAVRSFGESDDTALSTTPMSVSSVQSDLNPG